METVNSEFIAKLDVIRTRIGFSEIPQKPELLDRLHKHRIAIDMGNFIDFSHEGFDTLKLMIKAKLDLKKSSPGSNDIKYIASSIQDLRTLVNESNEIIGGIIRAEGLADILLRIGPFILIAAVVVISIFLFSHIFR